MFHELPVQLVNAFEDARQAENADYRELCQDAKHIGCRMMLLPLAVLKNWTPSEEGREILVRFFVPENTNFG